MPVGPSAFRPPKHKHTTTERGYGWQWQKTRKVILAQEPLCRICKEEGRVTVADEVDHIDGNSFNNERENLRPLCRPCHLKRTARDQAFGKHQWRPEWLRPATIPLVIVCGAPASGKTTFVTDRAGPTDLVIDLDVIAAGISGQPLHGWDRAKWLTPAIRARNEMLGDIMRPTARWPRAWLIVSEARAENRQWWADTMKPERIIVIETAPAECMARVRADSTRPRESTFEAIGKHVDSIAPFLGVGLGSLPLQGFSADWALAVYDEATGAIYYGVRSDGTFYPETSGGETPGMTLSVSGAAPNRQTSATIDGNACLLAKGGGDYYSATLSGWDASWTAVMASGTFVARARMLTATLVEQANIVMIPAYGQSLSTGRTNGTVADGSEVAPGKVYMYPPGIRVFGVEQKLPAMEKRLDRRKLDGFVPAKETASGNGGSTGWAVMGKRLTNSGALYASSAMVVATAGLGGASYNTIKKGTKYFDDYIQIVQQAKFLADYQNKGFTIPFAVLVSGEANRANDQSTFMGYLNEFQSDQSTLFKSITGQSTEVVLVTSQLSSWTAGAEDGIATSDVPLAQLQVALDDPTKHRCAGPKYQFDYVDGLHLTAESYDDHGEMVGRAINTPGWLPLHPVGATIDGAVITVEFHVPQGNLALDTSLVTNPGSYGVEFFQTGGSPVTISSVTVASATTLEITLSAPPAGTDQKVGFGLTGTPNTNGGPSTGPRTCIRDSSTDVSARGNPMYNWCCHSIIDMGTVAGFIATFDSGGEDFIATFDDSGGEEQIAIID